MPATARQHSLKLPLAAVAGLLSVANVSCGKSPESLSPAPPLSPAREIAETVSITGRVTLAGPRPAEAGRTIDVGGNPFCTQHGALVDPAWKISADGGLADVVIRVRDSSRASNIASQPVLVDQVNCLFTPTLTAIQAGQSARFRNSDLTFHNVRIVRHKLGAVDGGENLANYAQASMGGENIHAFDQPGLYRVECDVHRWMRAWIAVEDGAHFAVSAADGSYEIKRALADGEHVVEAWHPQFSSPLTSTVQVRDGRAAADFTFQSTAALRP